MRDRGTGGVPADPLGCVREVLSQVRKAWADAAGLYPHGTALNPAETLCEPYSSLKGAYNADLMVPNATDGPWEV